MRCTLNVEAAVVAVPAEQFDLLPEQLQKLLKLGTRFDWTSQRERRVKEKKERKTAIKTKRQEKKSEERSREGEAVPLEKNSFSFVWWASQ
jgi:peptide subunit release factor RF-3